MSLEFQKTSLERTRILIRVLKLMLVEAHAIDDALQNVADRFLISKARIVDIVQRNAGKGTDIYKAYSAIFQNYNVQKPLKHCYSFNTLLIHLLNYRLISFEESSITKDFILSTRMEYKLGAKNMFRCYVWDDRIVALEKVITVLEVCERTQTHRLNQSSKL